MPGGWFFGFLNHQQDHRRNLGNVLFEVEKINVTLPRAEIISRIFDVDVLYLVSVLILVTSFFFSNQWINMIDNYHSCH